MNNDLFSRTKMNSYTMLHTVKYTTDVSKLLIQPIKFNLDKSENNI